MKMVKYKNMTDKMVLIRDTIKNERGEIVRYRFYDCNPGDIVDITEVQGNSHKFMKMDVELDKPKDEVEEVYEPKDVEIIEADPSYEETLKNIKGIGKKTVEDILTVFKTEYALRDAIKSEKELPFRNDVVNKLIRVFGE